MMRTQADGFLMGHGEDGCSPAAGATDSGAGAARPLRGPGPGRLRTEHARMQCRRGRTVHVRMQCGSYDHGRLPCQWKPPGRAKSGGGGG
jgi:hypothetical protein